MTAQQNRTTVANTTVRFFARRADAINLANLLTRGRDYQHNAKHFESGWLVLSVRGELHDVDGKLPTVVVASLISWEGA